MGILDGIVEWIAEQVMYGLDLINTSVLGALGCDMTTFLRYFPAAETMYNIFVALAIGMILLNLIWQLFKNYGLIGGLFLLRKPCSHKLSFLRPCYAIGAFRVFFLALDKAKQIALRGAGLDEAAQKIVFTREELSRNQGKPCYILEFYTDKCAYSYKVDAVSGDILEKNIEWRSRQESEPVSETVQSSDSNQRRIG